MPILTCTCKHRYQDELYGFGNRVHNFAEKGNNGSVGYRCTVCLNVKPAKMESKEKEKKDEPKA